MSHSLADAQPGAGEAACRPFGLYDAAVAAATLLPCPGEAPVVTHSVWAVGRALTLRRWHSYDQNSGSRDRTRETLHGCPRARAGPLVAVLCGPACCRPNHPAASRERTRCRRQAAGWLPVQATEAQEDVVGADARLQRGAPRRTAKWPQTVRHSTRPPMHRASVPHPLSTASFVAPARLIWPKLAVEEVLVGCFMIMAGGLILGNSL